MTANELFKEFPPIDPKAWKLKIQAELKGGDFNELLTHLTPEGIRIKPYYTAEDLKSVALVNPDRGSWKIGYSLDPARATDPLEVALEALTQGAERLLLPGDISNTSWLNDLENQLPDGSKILWECAGAKIPDSKLRGPHLFLIDPVGNLAATGNWVENMKQDLSEAVYAFKAESGHFRILIRGEVYQEAGANRVQELAYSLAHIQEYLLRLEALGQDLSRLPAPVFKVALGGNYFMDIAKLRALRKLWYLLGTASGHSGKCQIIARPSLRNKTLYDYNTNMLRTSLETMAAVLGGADVISNLPYDSLYQDHNSFGDRIARNQLLLLKHEGHLDKVQNPADGAYYIESLTEDLGSKALDLFKSMEQGGGLLEQLKSHTLQRKIRENATREQEDLTKGEQVLVGTTVYPNPADQMAGAVSNDFAKPGNGHKTLLEPLPIRRLALPYELKRLEDEAR
ncbi:heterodimeric methylmalonyl-CoA mutase small subunit [Robiginitalea myxolifaciens]|uniref:Heterodimeric methylmalonyl-CoA mutase small subunit n=1 Tax=Robiginitalea myxolifaciens TaxID=400055 RepID=A0A1I6FNA1_9FLAO|nr:methylmalonyl-CoA mutase family protein [Robiginitalea myxolifaciens]SFR31406.1 heterodimeric methylmalonyl-CoA mutase small subunit [Robiginitalea myxolifaciens]